MTIIKGLLIALLLVAGHSVPLQDDVKVADNEVEESRVEESEKYRLPKQVEPMHYDVKLIPHIVEDNFTTNGEMSIDVKVREPTNIIALHTVDITVDEPWTNLMHKSEEENADPVQTYVPKQHHYDSETQILTIRFEELLDLGTYTLHLKFAGILADDDRGFYRTFYTDDDGNKVWLAMTHFQPVRARQAFPCWDEPAIKATFKFSIKHYPNYTSLSNMPSMRTNVDESDGKVWTHFETTPLMSTNILGFVIADYDHVSNLDDTIRIWAPKKLLQYAPSRLEIAETAMREFEKYTNSSVHVPKMDHVTSPHYTSRATENWGMIVYKDAVLLSDERKGPIYSRLNNLLTLTHELAHQWFGNLVSPAWWQYLWLSEGTSTYLKYLIADKLIKDWRIMDCFVVDNVHYLFDLDSYPSRYQPRPINVNVTSHLDIHYARSYSNTYMKSAIILHMIANVLTQDVFRNGLIRYLEAHEYGSVTPDDLWKALQDAVDESDVPHNDFKVKEVMYTWFEQAGYPIVTIERDYATGKIKATQKKFQYDPLELNITNAESDEAWWIPINFATQSNLDFSSTLPTHWLKPQDENLTIEGVDVNDWIIVNKQLTGFYLVNYDITNWKRIAAFLNSDDYDKIAPLNRAQIINDAFYMFKSKQLLYDSRYSIICFGLMTVNESVWNQVQPVLNKSDNNFMGCSTNLDILQKQLTFNVSSWFSAFNMFSRMLKDPSNVDKAIDLFINNFANISRLEPNPDVMEYHMTIIQFIDKCNNEDQLQKVNIT
ncbi:hypothetical protein DMN91_001371 [Ooceraea biroi]|uniref:Aminopeptidase n=1 Tax=Ooceraea biroi TaxID=2015173 RepID=A0A3L8E4H6_OOCBI|nr:hypothetical protein DMN91_001371 [Ooceraea biroi]